MRKNLTLFSFVLIVTAVATLVISGSPSALAQISPLPTSTFTPTPLPPTNTPTPLPPTPTNTPVPPTNTPVPASVCDVILDDFGRSDGWVGSDWIGLGVGRYKIYDEELYLLARGALYWEPTTFGPDQEACITLTHIGRRAHSGVVLKAQRHHDRRGNIVVFYDSRTHQVGVSTVVIPGVGETLLATYEIQPQDGDQLGGRALADGTVEVYVNGVSVGSVDAGSFFANRGGAIGLWNRSPGWSPVIVDDFAGG